MTVSMAVLVLSLTTFAATNIDDIFLLTLFFARRTLTRSIVAGQYLGFGVIVLLSYLGAALSFAIPEHRIRLLGLLPLALGVKELLLIRSDKSAAEIPGKKQSLMSIAAITLANGADNVGVYVPFFRFNSQHLWLILIVYGVLVGLWCAAAKWLGQHPLVLNALSRAGHWLVPIVFIGLGVWILAF